MPIQRENINLLEEACKVALLKESAILGGKEIEVFKKSANSNIFSEFREIPENSTKICISQTGPGVYYILISRNINWSIAKKYIIDEIKESCGSNTMVSCQIFEDKIIALTITV